MARQSAVSTEGGCTASSSSSRRSDRFLRGLEQASRVTFVSHIHPDPDSLGAMLGLSHLVETTLAKPTRLTRDGPINRAENRAMIELLQFDLDPVERLDWAEGEAVVMVDSQPNTGRHNLCPRAPLYAVIDHHVTPGDLDGVPFVDVRRKLGATCSLVTRYLIEQEIPLTRRVATALLYGIETEVSGYPREAAPLDDSALQFLYPLADKDLLAKIRNARLPESYYECILQALQKAFVYDRLMLCWVDEMPLAEHAAEVCDFLMRFDQVDWVLVGGVCEDRLVLSVRSTRGGCPCGGNPAAGRWINGSGRRSRSPGWRRDSAGEFGSQCHRRYSGRVAAANAESATDR